MARRKLKICNTCQGTGHDANARPKVKVEVQRTHDATTKKKHVTKKKGSGCLRCQGTGVLNPEDRTKEPVRVALP